MFGCYFAYLFYIYSFILSLIYWFIGPLLIDWLMDWLNLNSASAAAADGDGDDDGNGANADVMCLYVTSRLWRLTIPRTWKQFSAFYVRWCQERVSSWSSLPLLLTANCRYLLRSLSSETSVMLYVFIVQFVWTIMQYNNLPQHMSEKTNELFVYYLCSAVKCRTNIRLTLCL